MSFSILLSLVTKFLEPAITFFSKPPGSWIALALAALLALWAVHHHGYASGKAECEAAHYAAATAEIARQNAVGTAVVARAETRAATDAAKDKQNQETVRYVVKTVYAQPDAADVCITADIADRLRDLD
jgi:hypothetical protein